MHRHRSWLRPDGSLLGSDGDPPGSLIGSERVRLNHFIKFNWFGLFLDFQWKLFRSLELQILLIARQEEFGKMLQTQREIENGKGISLRNSFIFFCPFGVRPSKLDYVSGHTVYGMHSVHRMFPLETDLWSKFIGTAKRSINWPLQNWSNHFQFLF